MTWAERIQEDKQLENNMSACMKRNNVGPNVKEAFKHMRECEECSWCAAERRALKGKVK